RRRTIIRRHRNVWKGRASREICIEEMNGVPAEFCQSPPDSPRLCKHLAPASQNKDRSHQARLANDAAATDNDPPSKFPLALPASASPTVSTASSVGSKYPLTATASVAASISSAASAGTTPPFAIATIAARHNASSRIAKTPGASRYQAVPNTSAGI